jgi:phosphoribosylformimino-5-aminoimidazole carboxamide ribotide isomerase
MQIYPAIDLQNGKCVRLLQGDFSQNTVYNDDPLAMADNFMQEGAKWLHLVDLDGAKSPNQNQFSLIKQIVKYTALKVQVGGGIRQTDQIQSFLDNGVERVIVGSYAVKKPEEVQSWLKYFGKNRLVLAMDITFKNAIPYLLISGWQETTQYKLLDLLSFYGNSLQHVICTDVSRDGTLTGVNFSLYAMLMKHCPKISFQASGGVQSLTDVQLLRENMLAGVIIGRALYEKKFTLREALSC